MNLTSFKNIFYKFYIYYRNYNILFYELKRETAHFVVLHSLPFTLPYLHSETEQT